MWRKICLRLQTRMYACFFTLMEIEMKRIIGLFTLLALVSSNASALAITTFTDRASWEAAVGTFSTEDFESANSITASTAGDTFTLSDFEIVIDSNHGFIEIDSAGTGPVISGNKSFFGDVHSPASSAPLFQTLNFFDDIFAFSADFARGDASGVSLHIGGEVLEITFSGTTFLGFTADELFSSVDIRGGNTGSGFYVLDNIGYASEPTSVPEPASIVLFGLGLLGAAFSRTVKIN